MSQPANQTKSTWWSVTEFQPEYQELLADGSRYASFVKVVYGGLEKCPKTGRIHYQGAIQCNRNVRFSQIKQWLPKAHLQPVKVSAENLKQYAMKAETSAGEKKAIINETQYFSISDVCLMLAEFDKGITVDAWTLKTFINSQQNYESAIKYANNENDKAFWYCVNEVLIDNPKLAGSLMNPALVRFYRKTRSTWLELVSMSRCTSITSGCGSA